jgi:hypothetical protein
MKVLYIIYFILFLLVTLYSCKKDELSGETTIVEGVLRDDVSKEPIPGVVILVDGVKTSSGMGIITDGMRKSLGQTTTDQAGKFKMKLKVFDKADRLQFFINPGGNKEGFVDRTMDIDLIDLNKNVTNTMNFTLSPTAFLKIKFKNLNPVSDLDFFYFGWYSIGSGVPKGVIKRENCGTVQASEALTWTGKDVCGTAMIETIAEQPTTVYWTVKKGGVIKEYSKSVSISRGVNEFDLNY